MSKFDTLDNIVRDICSDMQDVEFRKYPLVLRTVIRVIDNLSIKLIPVIQSYIFVMQDNNTIQLPAAATNAYKVAYVDDDKLIRLGQKPNIDRPDLALTTESGKSCSCTPYSEATELAGVSQNQQRGCSYCTFHNFGGSFKGELYGHVPRQFQEGYWNYDEYNNRIIFDSGSYVRPGKRYMIEVQIASGPERMKLIPRDVYTVIRARTMQFLYEGMGQIGASQEMHRQFKIEHNMYYDKFDNYSAEDWRAMFMGTWHNGIK